MDKPGNIILELTPLASDRPVDVRLRWVLKKLLREQQFRCTRVSSALPTQTPAVNSDAANQPVTRKDAP